MKRLLPLLLLVGCGGSSPPTALRAFIAQRSAAIESQDFVALADTYRDDYLQDCETKPLALERWRLALENASLVDVVDVSVSHEFRTEHLNIVSARTIWRIHLVRDGQTVVVHLDRTTLLRKEDNVWREWGDLSCP